MADSTAGKTIRAAPLDAFRVLVVAGADRVAFLQGQLTQDIETLADSGTALAGWASAKGRLLAVGQLIAVGAEIWWPLPLDVIDRVAKRLQMFILRAKVDIAISTMPVSGLLGIDGLEQLTVAEQNVQIGSRPCPLAGNGVVVRVVGDPDRAWLIGPAAEAARIAVAAGTADESTWVRQSIRTGQPFIVADTQEMFVPQMLNLDRIGAINFDKGCYVGQEIVARTQNLGRIKRRMYRFTADEPTGLRPGAGIHGADNVTGKIVLCGEFDAAHADETAIPAELLAVIPIDAAEGIWFADETRNIKLTRQPLPYEISA